MSIIGVLFTALLLSSCCITKETIQDVDPKGYELHGTMSFIVLEGGCWQFKSNDGTTYQISGEKVDVLLKDGQRADIIVRDLPRMRSICMAGKNVKLLRIVKLY